MHPNRASDEGESARAFLVRGRVQGVGFRHWTVQTARSLGLSGTVRNRDDGRVEVHAAGEPEDLNILEERLHDGPRTARVDGVEEVDPREEFPSDFQVVY